VCRQLVTRIGALERELIRFDENTRQATEIHVPRLFLLEGELMRAQLVVELDWVRSVVADLKAGTLTWSQEWLDEIAQRFILPAGETRYRPIQPAAKKGTKS
jgi:hypothetical protein